MQAVVDGEQDCGGAPVLMAKPPPLAVGEHLEGEPSGGASSGKSEPDALMMAGTPEQQHPMPPTATAQQAGDEAQQASPPAAATPPALLVPLPPPDALEGPKVMAEYQAYLQRWDAGDTLAQRWHRLTQSGKLADIRAEWDDWQLDLMLADVRTKTAVAIKEQAKAMAGFGGGLICSTRLRRGRGEAQQEADDSPSEEPRRVRSRRAPATLQDYQVDAATQQQTPDRTPDAYADAADAAASRQQQTPASGAGTEPASEESTDEAEHNVASRGQQQQQVPVGSQPQQQQQQQSRPHGRRGPLPAQPPKRVITRVQRSGAAAPPQQAASLSRPFNRVITPYNPAQLQAQQQQMQAQAQQMIQAMAQEQQQVAAAAAVAGVSPEMLDEFYAMGSRLGAAFGQGEGGPAGGLVQNPAAMAAFMHALYQYGAAPAALGQQVSSVMGGHQ